MTALVTLDAHPLRPGEEGPELVFDATDAHILAEIAAQNGSRLPVAAGERLSERQVLLGLLLPSADNFAEKLARWVGPSRDAFVARLDARARGLGMLATHFADPSGLDPRTTSTPLDLLRLADAALAEPVVAGLVGIARAALPDGTELVNTDYWVGAVDGWLGIKTGTAAGDDHELLFAARRLAAGGRADPADAVTAVGVVLGQPTKQAAMDTARAAVDAALGGYAAVDASGLEPAVEGRLSTDWGEHSGLRRGEPPPAPLVVRMGTAAELAFRQRTVVAPLSAGSPVGGVEASVGGAVVARWPVVTAGAVGGPSLAYRLLGVRG